MVTCEKDVPFQFQLQKKLRAKQTVFSDIESKKGKAIFSSSISKARLFVFRFFLSPPLPPPPLLLLNPIPLTRYYVERENVSNSPLNHGAKANSPEQTVRRARLDLSISVTRRRAGRWLRLAGRSLDQSRGSTTFRQPDRGRAGHHLDARALPRRVERLLEQRQDQPDVLPHRVFQRGHLPGQLVYSRVYLFHGSARSTLKVT